MPRLNFSRDIPGQKYDEFRKIAELDKIWDEYDHRRSMQSAVFWDQFWRCVIDSYKPLMVFLWNGYHIAEASLNQNCRRKCIETFFLERGPFAKSFYCDKRGHNFSSSFVSNYPRMQSNLSTANINAFKGIYFSNKLSNWEQPKSLPSRSAFRKSIGIPENKLIVFMPGQLDRDCNLKLFSPHFSCFFEAASTVIASLTRFRDQVFLLGKQHPRDATKNHKKLKRLFATVGKWMATPNIFDCLNYADAIISINSSSAVEGALLGKPILMLGHSVLALNKNILKLSSSNDLDVCIAELIRLAAREKECNVDFNFFRKLFSNTLFSTDETYVSLGFKSLSEFPHPRIKERRSYLTQQKLRFYTDWLNLVFQLGALEIGSDNSGEEKKGCWPFRFKF